MDTIKRVSRQIPEDILEKMVYSNVIETAEFANKDSVEAWSKNILTQLENQDGNGSIYSVEVLHDAERNIYYPQFNVRQHGIDKQYNCGL